MLTKLAMTGLMATIGTAAVGGATASAHEYRHDGEQEGAYVYSHGEGYRNEAFGHERREAFERMQRERRAEAFRHARWLRRRGYYRW